METFDWSPVQVAELDGGHAVAVTPAVAAALQLVPNSPKIVGHELKRTFTRKAKLKSDTGRYFLLVVLSGFLTIMAAFADLGRISGGTILIACLT